MTLKTSSLYTEEEVVFFNKKGGIKLSGTLTLPTTKNNSYPGIVLIAGSGPLDRDETVCGHKPFFVLADYLSKNGFSVLRYDKRGVGKSTGDLFKATIMDLADDVIAATKYLMARKELDAKNISLIGHSEGGILAPIVATRESVNSIVLMAGSCLLGEEILYLQNRLVLAAEGKNENCINKQLALVKKICSIVKNEKLTSITTKTKLRELIVDKFEDLTEEEKNSIKDIDACIDAQLRMMASVWFRSLLKYNPAPILGKVDCPVLAINGTKDLQVPYKENLTAIETALKKGGNKNYLIKEMIGLNHLFQQAKTGGVSEYSKIKETISPKVLEVISNWLKKYLNK